MKIKEILKEINYKAGYVVRHELIDGSDYGSPDITLMTAYNTNGERIGDSKWAYRLCKIRGIQPIKSDKTHCVCSIGYSEKDQKWYGWSHRAMYGFGIGHIVEKGNCEATSGWTKEYLEKHKDERPMSIGFECKTIEDCKKCAMAFAASVS